MQPQNVETLITEIHDILSKGFILAPIHRHFLESTFSVNTSEEFSRLMVDENNSDNRDMFLELLISPDDPIQFKLEPFIQNLPDMGSNHSIFSDRLVSKIQNISIAYNDSEPYIAFSVPPYIIQKFTSKLNINHKLPESLIMEFENRLSSDIKYRTCVKLRQTSFTYTTGTLEFLDLFIRKFGYLETDFMHYLECILPVLISAAHDSDMTAIRDLFIKTLASSRKHLARIKTVSDMLKTNTMETLMLQGVFIPPVSEEETIDRISMITEVLIRIYGWSESWQHSHSDIDLGSHAGRDSVNEIIKLLS